MITYQIIATLYGAPDAQQEYKLSARTRGDAIIQAQRMFARDFQLDRADEALVRVEFISEKVTL